MKTLAKRWLLFLVGCCVVPIAMAWVPPKSSTLVNDFSGILTDDQRMELERRLVDFDDSTSNQVAVVITPSLNGDEVMNVAQQIGETWGVGHEEFSNGVVILIKSKSDLEPNGDVAIATGYGVEGVLPDVFCGRIINDVMVEHLSEGDYYGALSEALDVILPVLAGEYSYENYKKDENQRLLFSFLGVLVLAVVVCVLVSLYEKKHPHDNNSNGNSRGGGYNPFWGMPMSGMGGFGGGSFGSGSFGGFGGGHFGGGGAHGKF